MCEEIKKIAVLLTVHNRKEITLRCLRTLYGATVPQGFIFDVYLTDDGCTDGTAVAVISEFPFVRIIQGNGELYWNRGMNAAWKEAAKYSYDFYLWLNDDVELYDNALEILCTTSQNLSDRSIVCGAVENKEQDSMTYGGIRKWQKYVVPNGNIQEIDYCQGNIVLVPRFVFERVGYLDSFYGHSRGDSDYGLTAGTLSVKSYEAAFFLGSCEWHSNLPKCYDPKCKLCERWRALYQKTGNPPYEVWYYWNKHRNAFIAMFECFKVYMRVLFPNFWILVNKANLQ